jgi:hypothetical protein
MTRHEEIKTIVELKNKFPKLSFKIRLRNIFLLCRPIMDSRLGLECAQREMPWANLHVYMSQGRRKDEEKRSDKRTTHFDLRECCPRIHRGRRPTKYLPLVHPSAALGGVFALKSVR